MNSSIIIPMLTAIIIGMTSFTQTYIPMNINHGMHLGLYLLSAAIAAMMRQVTPHIPSDTFETTEPLRNPIKTPKQQGPNVATMDNRKNK